MNRTQKSIRNTLFALLAQAVTTLLTFVTRTVMTWTIGIEAISLNSLFNEVIAALTLAELGIGSAIVYNLYKPLAEGDQQKVCQLMTLFRNVYRIIAAATLVIGTAICPFVQYLIKDIGYDIGYIRLIYMLFVVQISSSYLFSYKISLLDADQNHHLYSIIATVAKLFATVLMFAALYITRDYVAYLIVSILTGIATNVAISVFVDRRYAYLRIDKSLPKEERRQIFSNVKNIFVKQLSGKITNSTDNILISVLVSTLLVGYYSFYAVVFNTFKQLLEQFESSIRASFGNLFATESNDRCNTVLFRLTWLYGSLGIIICTCIYVCMQPFITVWVGEEYLLPHSVLTVLCVNLFADITCKPIYSAMHISGLFKQGRNISLIGSGVNLVVSVVLGWKLGMLGIFIGTFMTYLIQIVLKIRDVYKLRFGFSGRAYGLLWIQLTLVMIAGMFLSDRFCRLFSFSKPILSFLVNGISGFILSALLIWATSFWREEWHYAVSLAKNILCKKRKQQP